MRLTGEGRLTSLQATPPHIELARDRLIGALSEEQLGELATLLEPIGAQLDSDRGNPGGPVTPC